MLREGGSRGEQQGGNTSWLRMAVRSFREALALRCGEHTPPPEPGSHRGSDGSARGPVAADRRSHRALPLALACPDARLRSTREVASCHAPRCRRSKSHRRIRSARRLLPRVFGWGCDDCAVGRTDVRRMFPRRRPTVGAGVLAPDASGISTLTIVVRIGGTARRRPRSRPCRRRRSRARADPDLHSGLYARFFDPDGNSFGSGRKGIVGRFVDSSALPGAPAESAARDRDGGDDRCPVVRLYWSASVAALLIPAMAGVFCWPRQLRSVHYLELSLRLVSGSLVPERAEPALCGCFRCLRLGSPHHTAGLLTVPWQWHRRFAQRSVPQRCATSRFLHRLSGARQFRPFRRRARRRLTGR